MSTRNRLAAALLALLVALSTQAFASGPAPLISTSSGQVRGKVLGSAADVMLFRGIPYAAPPVGALRWREPQPPSPWRGVREAFEAPGCPQVLGNHLPWTAEYMHGGAVSEDCLYLNVWTPAKRTGATLPVLVYLYGGAFSQGSLSVPLYDGAALARRGVVVVVLNYRLGALGFLAHPALTQESPHHSSGNYGLLDQLAALRWVQQNIHAFGGDPGRVTLSGQSAGAIAAYQLSAIPSAHGLFQRLILQSGPGALTAIGVASGTGSAQDFAAAQQAGAVFAQHLGASSAAQLRALTTAQLLMTQTGTAVRFGPVVDGWLLPDDPGKLYAQHRQSDVPMLVGMMADEPSAFGAYDAARAATTRAQGLRGIDQLLTERARTSDKPAYAYFFAHAVPWPEHPEFGAFHSGELPYVFDNLALLARPWTTVDHRLAQVAAGDWVAFATQGIPDPAWAPYQPGHFNFMVFGESAKMDNLTPPP